MGLLFGGAGVTPSLRGLASNVKTLQPGEAFLVPPGTFLARTGRYSTVQFYDPIAQFWRVQGGNFADGTTTYLNSDGVNTRIVNQTGCAVGALITTAGSGYTTAPTVTASAGGSLWRAIIGGAVSTTVSVTNAGSNYTYPPTVQFSAPPPGGVQATGIATLSSGTVSSITVTNQGAGYAQAPTVSLNNDPRELTPAAATVTTGFGASAIATLTGAGTMTGLICLDHGTPLTSVPTLTFGSGAAAATVLMCWSILGYTVTTAGNSYAGAPMITALSSNLAASTITNPETQANLVRYRKADLIGALSGNVLTGTGQAIRDGGIYWDTPANIFQAYQGPAPTTAATLGLAMGGVVDTVVLTPA